jgi:hypothetical protein
METDLDKQIKRFVIQNRENRKLLLDTAEMLIGQSQGNVKFIDSAIKNFQSSIKILENQNHIITKFLTSEIKRLDTQTHEIEIMFKLR